MQKPMLMLVLSWIIVIALSMYTIFRSLLSMSRVSTLAPDRLERMRQCLYPMIVAFSADYVMKFADVPHNAISEGIIMFIACTIALYATWMARRLTNTKLEKNFPIGAAPIALDAMKYCPFSELSQWLIAAAAIVTAIFFRKYFLESPIFMSGLLIDFVICIICFFLVIVFRKKSASAFYFNYIVWFFLTYSLVFEFTLNFMNGYFKQ